MMEDQENLQESVERGSSQESEQTDAIMELSYSSDALSDTSSHTDSEFLEDEIDESLASNILLEIQQGTYVCLVCISEIDPYSEVWSCSNCFRVYDLDCIKDWATRGSSKNTDRNTWKCPACSIEYRKIPQRFTCWCGKVSNPKPNSSNPFSCGNVCGKHYETCIHSCTVPCHPGKHPLCGAMGPVMKCECGKEERQLPCLVTPYGKSWKCSNPCDISVCNMGHGCPIGGCHLGFCGPCKQKVEVKCYCGKNQTEIECSQRYPKECKYFGGEESWVGFTYCDEKTRVFYDCKIHYTDIACKPPMQQVEHCKFSPDYVKTCHCGKKEFTKSDRNKCTDPIPSCGAVCGKKLACGCTCSLKCHEGECECFNVREAKCNCENYSFLVPCKFLQQGHRPKCARKCPVLLSCRRHVHKEVCCQYEQVALRRERSKKKALRNRVRSSFDINEELMSIEPVHICTRTCNRLKPCGLHYCDAVCHSGPCGVCLESSNDDLVCNCGKTVIPAPVRCGTKIICNEQCVRPKPCGHEQEPHKCHEDDVQCPKCVAFVTKRCNCGKKEIKNVLCSQSNVSCGTTCNERKPCGHPCNRVCVRDCTEKGEHASSNNCQFPCRKYRKNCPHSCKMKCHYSKIGVSPQCDSVYCKEKIVITCECKRRSETVPCGSSLNTPSSIGAFLECDEICFKEQKMEELKKALNLNDSPDTNYESVYLDYVVNTYERQTNWCSRIESYMRDFVLASQSDNKNEDTISVQKSHNFPSMSHPQRKFIHELASTYGLYSESQDAEPQRNVFIVITRLTNLPKFTIAEEIEFLRKREQKASQELIDMEMNETFFNAIVIQDTFFGVTKDELEKAVETTCEYYDTGSIETLWIKESTYVVYDKSLYKDMDLEKENQLFLFLKKLKTLLRERSLAFDCKLCLIDSEANYILRVDGERQKKFEKTVENNDEQDKVSKNAFDILASEELF